MKKLLFGLVFAFPIAFAGPTSDHIPNQTDSEQPWVNTNVDYVFACTFDNVGGSGCSTSELCPNSGFSNEHTFTENGGPIKLCYSDNAGNEVFQEETYVNWIDKELPKITNGITCQKRATSGGWTPYNEAIWSNQDVRCSFNVTDSGGSNIKKIISGDFFGDDFVENLGNKTIESIYAVDGIDKSSPIVIFYFDEEIELNDTFSAARFVVTDYATNKNIPSNQIILDIPRIKIDRTKPDIEPVSCITDGTNTPSTWTNGDVTCEYEIKDPNPYYNSELKFWDSDITATGKGRVTPKTWNVNEIRGEHEEDTDTTTESSTFSEEQNRTYTLDITAEDHASNQSTDNSQTFDIKIDKTPPVINFVACTANPTTTPTGWTKGDVTCSYEIDDDNHDYNSKLESWNSNITASTGGDGSLVADTWIVDKSSENTDTTPTPESYTFSNEQDRAYTLDIDAKDNADNPATHVSQPFDIKIDTTFPTIAPGICAPNNTWTNGQVTCGESKITDPNFTYNSGLESWNFTLSSLSGSGFTNSWSESASGKDENSWTETVSNFTAEQERTYTLLIETTDNAGNPETNTSTITVKIDRTKPVLDTTAGIQLSSQGLRIKKLSSSTATTFEADEDFDLILNVTDPLSYGVASGIDWGNSTISISGPVSLSNTPISALSSVGISFNSSTKTISFNDASDIFEKAGTYTINLTIKDNAGNSLTPTNITNLQVKIVASEYDPDPSKSSVSKDTTSCDDTELANNDDICTFKLTFKDRFENVLKDRIGVKVSIVGQDKNGSYDFTDGTSSTDIFANGLRFNTPTFPLDPNGEYNLEITALTPSVKIITSPFSSSAFLMQVETKGIQLHLKVPEIKPNGDQSTTETTSNNGLNILNLTFEPWVKASLSNNPDGDPPSDPLQFSYGDIIDIHAYTTTDRPITILLPDDLKVKIQGYSPSSLAFNDEDLSSPQYLIFDDTPRLSSEGKHVSTYLTTIGGVINGLDIAFSSVVEHTVDDNGTERIIIYPGGNLGNTIGGTDLFNPVEITTDVIGGNLGTVTAIIIGADIEGQILTDELNFVYQSVDPAGESSGITRMGNISALDIREDITRNAYELIRGLSSELNNTLSGLTFGGNNVKYFTGNVTLSGSISGIGTIVIEDGNLIIDDELTYNNEVTDSLGVILINSSTTSHPSNGNIYVTPNVKNIVGTYFADGGFMSVEVDYLDNLIVDIVREDESLLEKQLLLNGTLLTRNTLGGSMLGDNITINLLDPWGKAIAQIAPAVPNDRSALEVAQKYDLHFVRRYKTPIYTVADVGVDIPDNTLVGQPKSDDHNALCAKVSGVCDLNKHAFVIRPDGKVKNLPPPGF